MIRKAIFFEEAYKQGILPEITEGYIFSLTSPDIDNVATKMDPFLLQMVSYSGLKTVIPIGNGLKYQAQGKRMYCMLEPANFSDKHVEPISRTQNSTAYMPYRFNECEIFFTKDFKFRVLIPKKAVEMYDSFTIDFPERGDICVLYFLFDKDINSKVLPFIEENIAYILKSKLPLRGNDTKEIAKKFMHVVKQFQSWET